MKTWGPGLWAIFATLIVVLASLLRNIYSSLALSDCLARYLIGAAAVAGYFYWKTKRNAKEGRTVHIHHYLIGLIFACTCGYQDELLTVAHAFFSGMFIEGGCRWGFDEIWPYSPTYVYGDPDQD
mmetsp:Transcript_7366/g.8866  ORF Transcript_7366/g.8866 Transcript_7366/m.8866 type:complete len:125 (+) Transcript_7366:769-1143(+)